jgi:hypothetical protein
MKKLLEKLGKEEKKDVENPKDHKREELGVIFFLIKNILKKHNKRVPDELFEDLLRWKDGQI